MVGLAILVGCGGYEPAKPAPAPAPPPEAKPEPAPVPPKPPETVQTKAEVGVGAKGHYGGEGFVTTPVATLFSAKEMIAFQIQVPDAMRTYKALEGHAPKTHEEFMEKIIKENQIALPQLPEGERYLYDPKTEQLMVERPAPQ